MPGCLTQTTITSDSDRSLHRLERRARMVLQHKVGAKGEKGDGEVPIERDQEATDIFDLILVDVGHQEDPKLPQLLCLLGHGPSVAQHRRDRCTSHGAMNRVAHRADVESLASAVAATLGIG